MGKSDQLLDFSRFKFGDDARYKEWRSKIEITDAVSEQKLQAKWYKKNIDVNFDLAWLGDGAASAAKPAQAGTTASSSSAAASGGGHASRFTSAHFASTPSSAAPRPEQQSSWSSYHQQQQTAGSRPGASQGPPTGPSSHSGSSARAGALTDTYLFLYHIALVVLCMLYLVPVVPKFWARAYSMFMQLATVGQAYKVLIKFGVPQGIWPFSWPHIRAWLAQVAPTSELHFLLLAVAFGRQPSPLLMLPLAIPALYSVLAHGSAKLGHSAIWAATGKRLEAVLMPKQREAMTAAAFSEIAAAFTLVLSLFGRNRNFINVLLYWNLLKMRFHISDQSWQHKAAWHAIGQKVLPLRVRFRLLDTAINYVAGWFTSVGRQ